MPVDEVDIVIIGLGPGGEDLGGRLAHAGLRVCGVESRLVGGECPYFACIPTKMMARGAGALGEARRVPELAGDARVWPDWTPVADRIRDEATGDWDDSPAARRFESAGGWLLRGHGRVTGAAEVTVESAQGERVLRARRGIVLNPGSAPTIPPIDGLHGTPFWTNREAVRTRTAPRSLLVLGGGPVGLEFAQAFSRFGTETTVLEGGPRLLSASEPEASESVAKVFHTENIGVHTGSNVYRVRYSDERFTAELEDETRLAADELLVATGRHTDLVSLGVSALGIDETGRTIPVDERMRAADGVWAIGDVTDNGAFTHTSVYQAGIAAADILGQDGPAATYRALPAVTFTDPEVATVGLTEAAAVNQGLSVRTGTVSLASSVRGWIHKVDSTGVLKLVADREREILVGATAVGPSGGEIIGALAVAVHAEVPLAALRNMMFAYPTFHRAIDSALTALDA